MKTGFRQVMIRALLGATTFLLIGSASAAEAPLARRVGAPPVAQARLQGTGELITYQVRDGHAIIGGDIAVGLHTRVQREGIRPWLPKSRGGADTSAGAAITTPTFWTDNTLYYTFDPSLSADARAAFLAGIKIISDNSLVKFKERTNQPNYVQIIPGGGCYSYLGMIGGRQDLSLGFGCEIPGIAAHEVMHALGYQHEHQRPDRDDYIDVHLENVDMGYWSQLAKMPEEDSRLLTVYDYDSVMHYPTWAFSFNGQPTIVPKNGVDPDRLGRLVYYAPYGLSPGDVASLAAIYTAAASPWDSKKSYKNGDVVTYNNTKYTFYVIDTGTGLNAPFALKGLKPTKVNLASPKFGSDAYMAFWLTDQESFANGQLPMPATCKVTLSVKTSKFSLLIGGTSKGFAADTTSQDSSVSLQSGSKIQKWKAVVNKDGYYQIVNDKSGYALGVKSNTVGTAVLARKSASDASQQWCPLDRGGNYELRNRASGLPAGLAITRSNEALKLTGNAAVFEFKK